MLRFFKPKKPKAEPSPSQKPDAPLRYFFKYEGNTRAVVYKRTRLYGEMKVAKFQFGADAQEYVNFKNGISA